MKSKLVAVCLALTILSGGAVAGIAADRLLLRPEVTDARPAARRGKAKRRLARFRKRLDLSEEQAATIGDILERTRQRVREIRSQSRPVVRAIREGSQAEILALLSPQQAAKYRKMIEKSKRRRERRR